MSATVRLKSASCGSAFSPREVWDRREGCARLGRSPYWEEPRSPSRGNREVPMSPFRRSVRPNSVMFAANYEDGRTAYFVVEGHGRPNDDYLAGPIAKERQEKGELPDGNIRTVKRVR